MWIKLDKIFSQISTVKCKYIQNLINLTNYIQFFNSLCNSKYEKSNVKDEYHKMNEN